MGNDYIISGTDSKLICYHDVSIQNIIKTLLITFLSQLWNTAWTYGIIAIALLINLYYYSIWLLWTKSKAATLKWMLIIPLLNHTGLQEQWTNWNDNLNILGLGCWLFKNFNNVLNHLFKMKEGKVWFRNLKVRGWFVWLLTFSGEFDIP